MKSQLLYDLKYINEHLNCLNYNIPMQSGFMLYETKAGESIQTETASHNYIAFVRSGKLKMQIDNYPECQVENEQMICIGAKSQVQAVTTIPSLIVILKFDYLETICTRQIFSSYADYVDLSACTIHPTEIRYPISSFLDLLIYCLRNQLSCVHFHQLKHRELFLYLRAFYTKEETAQMLYPILPNLSEFRRYIMENWAKYNTVNELILNSHYGRSMFFKRFKEEFGDISVKEWILNSKKQRIIELASQSDMNVNELMYELNISSRNSLNNLCHKLFNTTPSLLIRKLREAK